MMLSRNHRLQKWWLDKCLEGPDSGDHSTGDIVIEHKHCWNIDPNTFSICKNTLKGFQIDTYSMNTLKVIQIDKVSLSDIQNLRIVC